MPDFQIPQEVVAKLKKGESLLPPDAHKQLPENVPPEIKKAMEEAKIKHHGHEGWTSLVQEGATPPDIERLILPRNPETKDQADTKESFVDAETTEDSYTKNDVPLAQKTSLFEKEAFKIPIKDGDEDKFYFSILDEIPYEEEVSFCKGRFVIGLRSRSLEEAEAVVAKVNQDSPEINIQVDMAFAKYYLCYSVTYIKMITRNDVVKTQLMDKGTLEERCQKLKGISAHKYLMMSEAMTAFDKKIEDLQERAKQENF